MKVWCVFEVSWDGPFLVKIFSTEELANKFIETTPNTGYIMEVEEWEVHASIAS